MCSMRNWTHYESRESIIHEKAKQIIMASGYIRLPEVSLQLGKSPKYFIDQEKYTFIQTIEAEKPIESIRPDLTVVRENGEKLLIEITVSNPVNEQKLKKIELLDIDTIEIDLSDLTINQNILLMILEERLIGEVDRKHWLYNRKEKQYRQELTKKCRLMTEPSRVDKNTVVYGCPFELKMNKTTKRPYSYLKECKNCVHYFGTEPDNSVLCGCKNPIETLEELDMLPHKFEELANERIQFYKQISAQAIGRLIN